MLSEKQVYEMYQDQMERCAGYYAIAQDKAREDIYNAHIWTLCRLGKILEIPEADTMMELKALTKGK